VKECRRCSLLVLKSADPTLEPLPLGRVTVMHRVRIRIVQCVPDRHPWFLPWPANSARVASGDANGNKAACFVEPWALQPWRLGVSPAKPRGPVSDRAKRRDQAAKRRLGPAGLATLTQASKEAQRQPGCLFPGIAPS